MARLIYNGYKLLKNIFLFEQMVDYKEMIKIIKSKYPNFERKQKEDEDNDTSKAWAVPGNL